MVFLHGGPGLIYGDHFAPVTRWFLAHGYTVVAPEIAGSGTAGLANKSNSYSQNYVQDLKSVVHCLRERLDMQGKEFCVVAHSWGGFQLASLLTDQTAEERGFFKQAVFISPNLDSAQTRLFADASFYSDANDASIAVFEGTLVGNFEARHTGNQAEMDASGKMTVLNNPLIDQLLNEEFSPYYRLDRLPKDLPCLFFHAIDDSQVPVSLSVDAYARVNNAGGHASLLISSQGGHGFFKTGESYNASVTESCFIAVDSLVKQSGPSKNAVIDAVFLPDASIEAVEGKLSETDKRYENYSKVLEDFHRGIDRVPTSAERKKIPSREKLLGKIADAHENVARNLLSKNVPATHLNVVSNLEKAATIKIFLKKS